MNQNNLIHYEKVLDLDDLLEGNKSKSILIECQCPLCHGISFNPITDACGHLFCEQCFITHQRHYPDKCPMTNLRLKHTRTIKLTSIAHLLNGSIIKCKNSSKGCNWVGSLSDFKAHITNDCKKQMTNCRYEGCPSVLSREDNERHLTQCEYRTVKCNHCLNDFRFIGIKAHEAECPKVKVFCPQNCRKLVYREDIQRHIEDECMNTEVECPYSEFFCSQRMLRSELGDHSAMEQLTHNIYSLRQLAVIKKEVADIRIDIEDQCGILNDKIDTLMNNETRYKDQSIGKLPYQMVNEVNIEVYRRRPYNVSYIQTVSQVMLCPNNTLSMNNNGLKSSNRIPLTEIEISSLLGKKTKAPTPLIQPIRKSSYKSSSLLEEGEETTKESKQPSPQIATNIIPNKSSYDIQLAPKEIQIKDNKAKCIINPKNEHIFVFGSLSISSNAKDILKWQVKILSSSLWIGIGICCKETVLTNKGIITKPNHGTYGISTNGYAWSSNTPSSNNKPIEGFPHIEKGEMLKLSYNPISKDLRIRFKDQKKLKIKNVTCECGKGVLTPCIILIKPNDEVKLKYF